MTYFLTSSPFIPGSPHLNPANGFLSELRRALDRPCPALFVCADPDIPERTDRFGQDMRRALEREGFSFTAWTVLDGRNEESAPRLVRQAGLMILAGGHVPTQNAFFQRIGLRALLRGFDGALIGISAGSMNCAETVYAQPELAGEAVSPAYRRFLPGLGITKTMLLPHYQLVKNDEVDGLRVFEDVAYPDSLGRAFFALPDGSYLLGRDGQETIRGEAYRIADGRLERFSGEAEAVPLT